MMTPKDAGMDPVMKLVFELSKLPGIGEKTATRLAYHILKQENAYSASLAQAIVAAKEKISLCSSCYTFTDVNPCRLCSSEVRSPSVVCVVERPSDVFAIEQAGTHPWKYHVLHGSLSPLDGVGPDDLKIRELIERIQGHGQNAEETTAHEVILATNPSVEGEATALYLTKILRPLGIKVTKLAHGLPVGGLIEYTDKQTLFRALENRVEMR